MPAVGRSQQALAVKAGAPAMPSATREAAKKSNSTRRMRRVDLPHEDGTHFKWTNIGLPF